MDAITLIAEVRDNGYCVIEDVVRRIDVLRFDSVS